MSQFDNLFDEEPEPEQIIIKKEVKKENKTMEAVKTERMKLKLLMAEEEETKIDWDNITITQDDLWFLYRLKFGNGTRMKKSKLLPKFAEVFNKSLNKK